jgi:hypothetical protein
MYIPDKINFYIEIIQWAAAQSEEIPEEGFE